MKKRELKKKLRLSKESVANLNLDEMYRIKGGNKKNDTSNCTLEGSANYQCITASGCNDPINIIEKH